MPDMTHIKRVLIIRMSAIGDVVHALPLASALKIAYPHLEISWLVEEISAALVEGNPYLDHVFVIPRSKWKKGRLNSPQVWREYLAFIGELRNQNFDLTIDLQGYAKSALIVAAIGARYRFGWWRLKDGANLASRAMAKRTESLHRIDWFLDVARGLGVSNPVVKTPVPITEASRSSILQKLLEGGIEQNQPYVVINQAAGNRPRQWAESNYVEVAIWLAEKRNLPCVLVGTQPEWEICERMRLEIQRAICTNSDTNVSRKSAVTLNFAGKTGLLELASLLEMSVLHLCGDTGSTHIAAALGVPVISFYGASDPAHAGPWEQGQNVLSKRELCHADCNVRTCFYAIEQKSAEKSYNSAPVAARCMDAITPLEAIEKIKMVLSQNRVEQTRKQ